MEEKKEKVTRKAGRKPVYKEERVRMSFRAEKELYNNLIELVELKKKNNKDFTLNEYIVSVLSEKVSYDLFQMSKK